MQTLKQWLKGVLWRVNRATLRLPARPGTQEFSIAIYRGRTPFSLGMTADVRNPVLTRKDVTDVPAAFVADPFICKFGERWYMFFEVMNRVNWRGEIGFATSEDGRRWQYQRIVLAEGFHLSYPYVFEWQHEHYMIPESRQANEVRLYKATNFPHEWSHVRTILQGPLVDSSIFRYQDRWWLFAATQVNADPPSLRLYAANDLMGPWLEHPSSPILKANHHLSRPCGRIVFVNDRPIRFAQDVFPVYGSRVFAFEILDLSSETYKERQVGAGPVLSAGSELWNSGGMHHVDAHPLADGTWLACVDGFRKFDSH